MRTSVPNFTLKKLLGDYWDPISTILREEKEAAQKEAAKKAAKKEAAKKEAAKKEAAKKFPKKRFCFGASDPKASKRGLSGVEASSSGASDPKASKKGLSGVEASSSEPKIYEEKLAGLWLGKLLDERWRVHWNCEIPKDTMRHLRPYFISSKYRPDIWLDVEFNSFRYPLLMI